MRWTTERRSGKRCSKSKLQEVGANKRKIIGMSDYPKPYKQRDSQHSYSGLSGSRRDHSLER